MFIAARRTAARDVQVLARFVVSPAQVAREAPVRRVRWSLFRQRIPFPFFLKLDLHHVRLSSVVACLPASPVSQSSDVEEATAVCDFVVDEVHCVDILGPIMRQEGGVVGVEDVVVGSYHGPHVVGVAPEL